jgi:hypothetical protein
MRTRSTSRHVGRGNDLTDTIREDRLGMLSPLLPSTLRSAYKSAEHYAIRDFSD